MGYYSALRGKETVTRATTWMNLEDMKLSERNQSQKKILTHSIHVKVQNSKIYRDRKCISGCQEVNKGEPGSDC